MSSTWTYISECKGHLLELRTDLVPGKNIEFSPGVMASCPPSYRDVEIFWAHVIRTLDGQANAARAMFDTTREQAIRYLGMTRSRRAKLKLTASQQIDITCAALWYGRQAAMWLAEAEAKASLRGGYGYRQATEAAARFAILQSSRKKTLQFFPLNDCTPDIPARLSERWCWDLDDADPDVLAWS